jgi:phospholipid/cholesterol/gamma-HCH transport system permease protein
MAPPVGPTQARRISVVDVVVRADRDGDHAYLRPSGPFDLTHATAVVQAIESVRSSLSGCLSVDVDLTHLDRIDGTGAVLLGQLLDRLEAGGQRTRLVEGYNSQAAQLLALYRGRGAVHPPGAPGMTLLARIGEAAAQLPGKLTKVLDFTGRCAIALPKAMVAPGTVDWQSLPRLIQEIGADALLVTGSANLVVGIIIGLLGISQLGRFGAVSYVPELVVVAHLRELGPLVTAIVVAGRSGAGLASEIATMKVSEEIDALSSMGFDPVRWLVVPRCLALVVTVPLLTWVGDALALVGGLATTTVVSHMTARAYVVATTNAITVGHFLGGLVKTPFLALAVGLIACNQGLATQGGAAAVGARTTTAVVLAIFAVIVVNAVFTLFYALMGI